MQVTPRYGLEREGARSRLYCDFRKRLGTSRFMDIFSLVSDSLSERYEFDSGVAWSNETT